MRVKSGSVLDGPTDKVIEEFELFFRVKLPTDFIDFIKSYNGAIPEQLTVRADDQDRLVEKILCLLDDPKADATQGQYDISVVIAQIEDRLTDDENLIGANIIPFATVFGGDFLCLDFQEKPETPSVILWDHNESDELDPVTYPVAETVKAFLKKS